MNQAVKDFLSRVKIKEPELPWKWLPLSEDDENKAKAIRVERDKLYGNIFEPRGTDERWIGDAAEIVFNHWAIPKLPIGSYEWILENVAGKPDFLINGVAIDVKAVKRKDAPREYYTMQISKQHAKANVDHFFFMSYEMPARRMWFLGGIKREDFMSKAEFCPKGTRVHENYTVPADIYNIEIKHLIKPDEWLVNIL